MALVIVLAVVGVLAVVAVIVPDAPRRTRLRATSADGIPRAIADEPTAVRHRFARGSTPPPASSSLLPAHVRIGEVNVRRFATPMPAIDDGWDLIE